MGLHYSPRIVTNGLVLDAADRNSYVSGSSTWYDLSGNGNDVSVTTGPVFDTSSNIIIIKLDLDYKSKTVLGF